MTYDRDVVFISLALLEAQVHSLFVLTTWRTRKAQMSTPTFSADIDSSEDLSRYTTEQLKIMNGYLEPELMRLCTECGATMTEAEKVKWFDAVAYLNRVGAELLRRSLLPAPDPTAVHYETMPDGSDPIRLSFTVLAF